VRAWFNGLSPRAQVLLAMGLLMALAVTGRYWQPLIPDYWRGILAGWLSGWLIRGVVERQRAFQLRSQPTGMPMNEPAENYKLLERLSADPPTTLTALRQRLGDALVQGGIDVVDLQLDLTLVQERAIAEATPEELGASLHARILVDGVRTALPKLFGASLNYGAETFAIRFARPPAA
jgi:hypothetical protein